jgi:2-polyprenyl-6-methoxyphenol hydroxylase-like FAD-dependent oxidoreductase
VRGPLRIIIAGGGVAGLASAAALSRLGQNVTVLERHTREDTAGAHLGVQAGAMLALRVLGAEEPVRRAGVPVERYELRSWRGRRLAWWPTGEIGRELGAESVTVPRRVLIDALYDAVPRGVVRTGASVVGYTERADDVSVTLSDGTEHAGDLLIAADGLHSLIRAGLLEDGPPSYAGYVSWRGVADTAGPDHETGTARHALGAGRTLGMWPLPDGRTYWVLTEDGVDPGDGASTVVEPTFTDAFTARVPPAGRLLAHTEKVLRTPIYDRDPVTRWHTDRIALIGDAAHPMQPTTGQGAGQALLDALALATELARARGSDAPLRAALARYAELRGPQTARAVGDARQVAGLHHMSGPPRAVRDVVMRATPPRVWRRRATAPEAEGELIETASRHLANQGAYTWSDTR